MLKKMENNTGNFYIDVASIQKEKHANEICGDVFLTKKVSAEDRTIIVLSDGLGSGIKANILASVTASMAVNFTSMNAPLAHTAEIILSTLPVDRERKVGYSSFTIIDIEAGGTIHFVEYGNPEILYFRENETLELKKTPVTIKNRFRLKQPLFYSNCTGRRNDRIVVCSDGISQSGIGSRAYPFGWGIKNVNAYIRDEISRHPGISSFDLCRKLLANAIANDTFKAKDDITAGVVYLREARRLMVCSGPPYDENKDTMLARDLDRFAGTKIICGGTTANIIAREMHREICTNLSHTSFQLPPVSSMDNIDLITEGILTLGKAHRLLEEGFKPDLVSKDPAVMLCNHFLLHDEIVFVVGTKVNEAHQDPSLPVELEIRRNVIKKIARELEDNYLKTININYI
ncbi:MAG: SpoIIE family protein phosphatase [Bacteroidales bacterium]|nr:SpoIIE family protein phosphatase [Bacteroidales bacterium]